MSQILNGDMALNSRLASYLYAFKFAPRVAKWWLLFPRDEEGMEFVKAVIACLTFTLWIGIALSIIAFPQYLGPDSCRRPSAVNGKSSRMRRQSSSRATPTHSRDSW